MERIIKRCLFEILWKLACACDWGAERMADLAGAIRWLRNKFPA